MWDYTEKLVIDRATETIQFTRNIGTGCTFDEYGKEYCYLADEDIYYPGSKVTVPVGIEGRESTAKVARIEYFPKEKAPFPLDKIKRIKPVRE